VFFCFILKGQNILRGFCFILVSATAMTALADSPSTPGAAGRMVSVVSADQRTGKLVRSVVATTRREAPGRAVAPALPQPASRAQSAPMVSAAAIADAVERAAAQHSLPPQLIHSVIKVESNYNPGAVSSKGALGLMQLIPATARRFGVADVFDPVDNIQGGARYLRYLLDLYGGDYPLALAAYNAGEGAVAKYGTTVPPYPETQNYLKLVARHLREALPAAVEKPKPLFAPPVARPDDTTHVLAVVGEDGSLRYVSR
jgi:soluble lytic murein transglycosylase-like protein